MIIKEKIKMIQKILDKSLEEQKKLKGRERQNEYWYALGLWRALDIITQKGK